MFRSGPVCDFFDPAGSKRQLLPENCPGRGYRGPCFEGPITKATAAARRTAAVECFFLTAARTERFLSQDQPSSASTELGWLFAMASAWVAA